MTVEVQSVVAAIFVSCVGGLLLIWAGYPLLILSVARLLPRRLPPPPSAGKPASVSLIIASREGRADIAARVEDILRHRHAEQPLEIIVALDPGGGARPGDFGPVDRGVIYVRGDEPGGKATTLNAGVRAASGEILAFTDTFQRFDESTIRRLSEALEDHRLGAVSGALHLPAAGRAGELLRVYWGLERALRAAEARIHSSVGVTGAVCAVRRQAWTPLPAGLILDDLYIPMRLVLDGWRIGFEPRAVAHDTRPPAPEPEYSRKTRTLTGVLQLCVWLPGVLSLRKNPIWFQFIGHKLSRFATPFLVAGAVVSGLAIVESWLGAWRFLALLLVASLLIGIPGRPGAVLRGAIRLGLILQWATLAALWNAGRSRWGVWTR
ncbi:MAG TPA: glycosyltransferase [Gemmatimonadales bacterium]|jgi:cellulose synthase/poly-beta-1,6-N-acetylglucosamine synthase-like glycosyltransferase|nr:glycosyltransferase [Gemmatimonadales bacterium]